MYATFADVAGAKLPHHLTFDGHSFGPQLHGRHGKPREWVYVQLGKHWFVRSKDWKLTENGDLFDMKDAPFVERLVTADTSNAASHAGRVTLQKALDTLKPSAGMIDDKE